MGRLVSEDSASPLRSNSTSKWPEFAIMAPSFITRKCSVLITLISPVRVQKKSPNGAALAIGITINPSMDASRARRGSTSHTTT